MQAVGLVWGDVDSSAPGFQARYECLDGPQHPDAVLTQAVWRERMDAGGFVVGRDIPSRALSKVLRNLAIYEPVGAGEDYHIRLAGTAHLRRFGSDVSGQRLSELFKPDQFEKVCENLHVMFETREPVSVAVSYMQAKYPILNLETLMLPVRASDSDACWAMVGLFFDESAN
jgi:hypothetical protein